VTTPARKRNNAGSPPEGPVPDAIGVQAETSGEARALPGLAVNPSPDGPPAVIQRSVLGKLKTKIDGAAKKAAPPPVKAAAPAKALPVWGAATPKGNANNPGPKLATARANAAPVEQEQEQAEQEHSEAPSGGYAYQLDDDAPRGGYSSHLEAGPLRGGQPPDQPGGGYSSHLEADAPRGNARANHYSEVIPVNGPQPGEQEQAEQQDEPSHYNTDPLGNPVGNHYSEVIPVNGPQPGEQEQAEEQVQEVGPQRPPLPSTDPKRPQGDGTTRKHRAFQVNALGNEYGNEKTSVSGHLKGAIVGAVKTVKKYYAWSNLNSYGDADRLELLSRMTNNGLNVNDSTPDKVLHDFAVRRHKEELEKLRREELDITDAGILMHTTANGREPYPTENGQPDGDPIVDDRLVKYDETAESQEKTLVEVRGGAVYRSQASDEKGAKVDTANSVTHFSGAGYEIFVVDDKNQIHMASHKLGKFHHSSLLAGANVSMAGEMKIVDGKITYMSNKSGHYVPTLTNFIQFLHFLEKDGVPLDFEVALLGGPTAGKFPAKDLVAGKGSAAGSADKTKTYEVLKTNAVWKSFVAEFGADAVEAVIEKQGWELWGRDITDADGNDVDLKLVRRLLKQQLKGGASANVTVDKH
jgi:hypothetical protein